MGRRAAERTAAATGRRNGEKRTMGTENAERRGKGAKPEEGGMKPRIGRTILEYGRGEKGHREEGRIKEMSNKRTLFLLLHKALLGYDGGNDGPGLFLAERAFGFPA